MHNITTDRCSEYILEVKNYLLQKRLLSSLVLDRLEQKELLSYQCFITPHALFVMRDLDGGNHRTQQRYIKGIPLNGKLCKSVTTEKTEEYKDKLVIGYFYEDVDFTKPVVIVEGEMDYCSALTLSLPNVIGVQGIGNLKKLVEGLIDKGVDKIYLLVDQDAPTVASISKLFDLDKIHHKKIYDARMVIGSHKDLNDFLVAGGSLNIEDIEDNAKPISGYSDVIYSFLEGSDFAKPRINHNNFSKRLIEKFDYQSADKNIFNYTDSGIRAITDPHFLNKQIMDQIELWLHDLIRKKGSRDVKEIFELILINSYNPNLKKSLLDVTDNDLNLEDGILNTDTRELKPYTKEEFKIYKLEYHSSLLHTTQEPVRFLKFLDEVLEGHDNKQELIVFLQQFIGHLFLPITKYEVGLFLFGSGGNGKSVLLNVIKELIGRNNIGFVSLSRFKDEQSVYGLIGKLVNIDNEMDSAAILDSAIIKSAVSGEEISGKKLYKNPIHFSNYARFIIASNLLPDTKNSKDDSVSRRFCFINFKQSFVGNPNPNLIKELLEEKNLIFAWSIRGLKDLLSHPNNKLKIPEIQKEELKTLLEENDIVEMFLKHGNVRRDAEGKLSNEDIYFEYQVFCKDMGERPLSQISLSKKLVSKGFKRFEGKERGFYGLSIVNPGT